jgi:polyisoprenyl-phosphate glycosyltransferase
VMDSDGEDRVSSIPALLESLTTHTDVAVALRAGRRERQRFQMFYRCYRLIFKLLTGRNIEFGNFMAITSAATRVRAPQVRMTSEEVNHSVLVSSVILAS